MDSTQSAARSAPTEPANIGIPPVDAGRRIEIVDRPSALQQEILEALFADSSNRDRDAIASAERS